jgi:hypothetical protein
VGEALALPPPPSVLLEPQPAAISATAAEAAVIVNKRDSRCTCVLLSFHDFQIGSQRVFYIDLGV